MRNLKIITLSFLFYACTSNTTTGKMKNTEASISIEKLRTAPDSLLTKMRIVNSNRDYEVKKGEIIYDSIVIRNTGKRPLKIESIKSKCDCTTVDFNKKIDISMNDSIIVKYKIETNEMDMGNNHRTITIIGNFFPYFKNISVNLKID